MDMSDEERESTGDYLGRIVHDHHAAPYKVRIAALEVSFREMHKLACEALAQRDEAKAKWELSEDAYDQLFTDAEQGQRAAEEEIARLKVEKEQAEKALQVLALRVPNMLISGASLVCEVEELTRKNADQSHAIGVLRGDLQAERDKTEGMHREIASVGDINATLRIRVRHLEAEVERGVAEIVKLNDEQDDAYGRGLLEGAKPHGSHHLTPLPIAVAWHGVPDPRPQIAEEQRAETKDALDAAMADPAPPASTRHEPVAKSAIEVPKPETDEGEGMLIAYVPVESVVAGDRVRFSGYSGNRFVTVLESRYVGGWQVIKVRVPRNPDLSTPYGDFDFTMEPDMVVERDESERRPA